MDTLECPPSTGEEMSEKLKRLRLRFNARVEGTPRSEATRELNSDAVQFPRTRG
jgi:hypothetical protein